MEQTLIKLLIVTIMIGTLYYNIIKYIYNIFCSLNGKVNNALLLPYASSEIVLPAHKDPRVSSCIIDDNNAL